MRSDRGAAAAGSDPQRAAGPPVALDASISSTLVRGIGMLQCFTSSDSALTNAEISRRMGLNRPTVSRLCKTLVHLGYLRKDDRGAFRLSPKLLALAYPVLSGMPWRHDMLATMRELAAMWAGNVSLGVMSGDSFVHIETAGVPPGWPHVPDIGQTGPLHRSALGWSLLSLLQGDEFDAKIAEIRQLWGDDFARGADATFAAVARCRAEGFCVSYGDWRPDLVAGPNGPRDSDGPAGGLCASPYRSRHVRNDIRAIASSHSIQGVAAPGRHLERRRGNAIGIEEPVDVLNRSAAASLDFQRYDERRAERLFPDAFEMEYRHGGGHRILGVIEEHDAGPGWRKLGRSLSWLDGRVLSFGPVEFGPLGVFAREGGRCLDPCPLAQQNGRGWAN